MLAQHLVLLLLASVCAPALAAPVHRVPAPALQRRGGLADGFGEVVEDLGSEGKNLFESGTETAATGDAAKGATKGVARKGKLPWSTPKLPPGTPLEYTQAAPHFDELHDAMFSD